MSSTGSFETSSVDPDRIFDLTVNGVQFEVTIQEEPYVEYIYFAVARGSTSNGRGCVVIGFDKSPNNDTAVLDWFGYSPDCSKDSPNMDRGNSKPMLIGALTAFRDFVQGEYPHIQILELADEATFTCPGKGSPQMQTMVASLLLHGKSYYERLLNVRPSNRETARKVGEALERVNHQAGSLQWIVDGLGKWGTSNYAIIDAAFSKGGTWGKVISRVHRIIGCPFFEACSDRLADMFKISSLKGSAWSVPLIELPDNNLTVTFIERDYDAFQIGGSKAKLRGAKLIAAAKKHRANMIAASHRRRNWPSSSSMTLFTKADLLVSSVQSHACTKRDAL